MSQNYTDSYHSKYSDDESSCCRKYRKRKHHEINKYKSRVRGQEYYRRKHRSKKHRHRRDDSVERIHKRERKHRCEKDCYGKKESRSAFRSRGRSHSLVTDCSSVDRYTRTESEPYRFEDELHRKEREIRGKCMLPFRRNEKFSDLPIEWWERNEECKDAKSLHTEKIDYFWPSREDLVLQTTLADEDTVLEPNMFPYDTPKGVKHYTLWSVRDMQHHEIVSFVDNWLEEHFPQVRRWQYDDNFGERSFLLFHVHVFIEMDPFSFTPRDGLEYFPPHVSVS